MYRLARLASRALPSPVIAFKSLTPIPRFAFAKPPGIKSQKKADLQKEKAESNVPVEIDLEPLEAANKEVLSAFEKELKNVRIGKLVPDVFKTIFIQGGSGLSVFELSQILPVNATSVTIAPYDQSQKKQIQLAISRNKFNDFEIGQEEGDKFTVSIPPGSTKEKRDKLLKIVQNLHETHKGMLRDKRHQFLKTNDQFTKFWSKDVVKNLHDEVDAVLEKATKQLEKLAKLKEKDLK